MNCPRCGQDAKFVNYRQTTVHSLFGAVPHARAYYHCRHCHSGWIPTDREFRIRRQQTPAVCELISQAGVLQPFEEVARRVLPRMAGLHVCTTLVQQTVEEVGQDIADRRAAGETFGTKEAWEWQKDAAGQPVAYVSLDATSVPQQGPDAKKAEGRMPWVGSVFNPPPKTQTRRPGIWDTRYVAGLGSLQDIGTQLRRDCEAVGITNAKIAVALTDGGNGLEVCLTDVLAGKVPQIVFILDFYHVTEHLREFVKVWIHDDKCRQQQESAWCHLLKHQGGAALLEAVEALDLSKPAAAARVELVRYLRNNLHRTDYPTYVARGWQIGSGMIESACKTVVAQRLKCSGMRWREYGTNAVTHLRALYRSEASGWENYWREIAA